MLKNRAYKYRLYPTEEQKIFFAKTFGCVRFVYNVMLHDKVEHYKITGEMLKNTPAQYKSEYPFLKEVDSLALANAQLNLEKAYKNFFRELKKGREDQGFPKYKKKIYNQSYTTNNQAGTISIVEDKHLNIPKLKTLVKIKLHRQIPADAHIKSVTIERTSSGKFYASILVLEDIKPLEPLNTKVAIDLGIKRYATLSSGINIANPKNFLIGEDKLIKFQRALSRKKKGSSNYYKNKRKLAVQHEKISNQRKDFLHKLSRQLIDENQVINIETLLVKNMLKNPLLAKAIADASWSLFVEMLVYKADWYGRTLNKADAFYASSQLCHICNYKNSKVKNLAVRKWTCPKCNTLHDRDDNATQNLLKIG